ncbi:MAG: 50S ribosomal protein L33 [Myxococcales bacterium FL481]|nr:MAG: 50S ribosomal protein L33 [Myxococcales bacterium FL481]
MAVGNRLNFILACGSCRRRNYATTKNKRTTPEKVTLRKFCCFCGQHTEHKESK